MRMLRERGSENLEGMAKNWMPLKEDNNLNFRTPLISVYLGLSFVQCVISYISFVSRDSFLKTFVRFA